MPSVVRCILFSEKCDGKKGVLELDGETSLGSSGEDSMLPLQGTMVRSLVGELRSCMPNGQKKKKKRIVGV